MVTFDIDSEACSETGSDIVESGAEELSRVVGADHDPGLRAVHTGLPYLDPGHAGGGGTVRDQAVHPQHCVRPGVLQGANIRLQDDSG